MILRIDDHKTVGEVQDKFNECFPYLKIDFFKKSHHVKKPSDEKDLIGAGYKIGDIRKKHTIGNMEIYSWNTVATIEQAFKERYGLHVQILRKENNHWVQTTKTDIYTLKKQSEMAMHAANSIEPYCKDQSKEYKEL